jgi:hypothetical protein
MGVVSRWVVITALMVLLTPNPLRADEVRLSNGDRISGQVVALANNTLVLMTPHGELRLPWTLVVSLAVVEPIFVTVGTQAPASVRVSPGESGTIVLRPGTVVPITEITAISRPLPPPLTIVGRVNAGIVASTGNSPLNTLRIGGELVGRTVANRVTLGGTVNRARDRNVDTARNWTTSFRYDRFITRRLFVNGNTIVSSDRLRDLVLRTAVGTGLGYQVLDRPRVKITMDGGIGYVRQTLAFQADQRYTAAQESAKVDVLVGGSRYQLFHRHDGYFGLTGDDRRFVKTQNGVRVGIVGGLITTAQLDVDYDPTPVPGRQSFDRTFAVNFGYQF